MIQYLGGLTVGALAPAAAALNAELAADAQAEVELQADIGANVGLALADPTVALAAAVDFQASGAAEAILALSPADFVAAASVNADVSAQASASATARLAASASLSATLGVGGIHAYVFSGPVGSLGPELAAELAGGVPGGAGPGQPANAVIFIATTPAAWAALGAVLKVG